MTAAHTNPAPGEITAEQCRKCGTNLVKKPSKNKKRKQGQTYYFEWTMYCPGCKTLYLDEEAKQMIQGQPRQRAVATIPHPTIVTILQRPSCGIPARSSGLWCKVASHFTQEVAIGFDHGISFGKGVAVFVETRGKFWLQLYIHCIRI